MFLSGDYEFLSRMYGLSGASGKNIFPIWFLQLVYNPRETCHAFGASSP